MIVIVGPTAVGKTAVAVEFVSLIGGEIVSADSMAVYVGMDIGTAKPTADERSRASFHLIDVADPAKPFCVAEFASLAHEAIDDILAREQPAIVVGGSGLYVRAAIDGLGANIPGANDELRRRLNEDARTHGNDYIHAKLAEIDPASAERIHSGNLKRVIRALEIYDATGIPASVLFEADSKRPRRYENARFIGLTMDREALYNRIESRVDAMIDAGLIDEVSNLLQRGISLDLPSMQGLGYREIAEFIGGKCTRDEAIAQIKKNTRRFAKRQYTWFKADPRVKWLTVDGLTASEVSSKLKELIK